MSRRLVALSLVLPALLAAACSDEASEPNTNTGDDVGGGRDTGGGDAGGDDAGGGGDAGTDDTGTADGGGGADTGVEPTELPPDPMAYSDGACPTLESGTNTFSSSGRDRSINVYFPDEPAGAGVVFMWHGAGDSAGNFSRALDAQGVADEYNVVAIVPSASGSMTFEWPIMIGNDTDVDAVLFDDVISCLDEQFDIDNTRVYTTGFSAGALWSTWLIMHRAEYLAAATTFSGGTSSTVVSYETPARTFPVLAIHGGTTDVFGGFIHFDEMTVDMTTQLVEDGHPVIECDHGRGHTIPFDPYEWAFPFMFEQRFGAPSLPDEPLGTPWPAICDRLQ